jgi:hypothetical protein
MFALRTTVRAALRRQASSSVREFLFVMPERNILLRSCASCYARTIFVSY